MVLYTHEKRLPKDIWYFPLIGCRLSTEEMVKGSDLGKLQ